MPTTTILITEPSDPVLGKLAMRLMQKPDLRLLCFSEARPDGEEHSLKMFTGNDRELRFRNCDYTPVDEIWHAKNPNHSFEESREATQRVLSFARKEKTPVVHYVSALPAVGLKGQTSAEPAMNSTKPARGSEEECHRWNEDAIEQSGCKFRIYRIPPIVDGTSPAASVWTWFVHLLRRFRDEIEDRVPGYFTANPLRIYLAEEGTASLARSGDIAQAVEEILSSNVACSYFQINVQQPAPLKEYFPALTELTGVLLQIVSNKKDCNLVDKLFGSRMKDLLPSLNCTGPVLAEWPREHSTVGSMEVWVTVPQASMQDVLSTSNHNGDGHAADVVDWRSGFEKKQVLLPEGVALNYCVGGQGDQTLVLLNAYGQSFGYWERFLRAVSSRVRMILWIPRGNDSGTIGLKLASPWAVHADDLECVLKQEGVDACTLAAWCSGPKLALEYYSRYPNRVSSMVFVAGSFKGLQQHRELETEYEKNLESLLETIEKFPETADVVLEYLKGILLAQNKQTRSIQELSLISDRDLQEALSAVNVSLQDMVLQPFHPANVVAYARQMRDFWNHNFLPALNTVEVPVLFVGGDCDRIASQPIAKLVAAMIPHAKYLEIKGGTHYIHYEQWDLLAQAVEDIVNSGGKLEFTPPWVSLTAPSPEPMSTRQSQT